MNITEEITREFLREMIPALRVAYSMHLYKMDHSEKAYHATVDGFLETGLNLPLEAELKAEITEKVKELLLDTNEFKDRITEVD